jgi:hypothetical protein
MRLISDCLHCKPGEVDGVWVSEKADDARNDITDENIHACIPANRNDTADQNGIPN